MAGNRIPLWLKIAYTVWMAVWIPVYSTHTGPANFLWLCDVANFVVLPALWLESRLLFSSQAVSVLLIQLAWMIDVAGRLVLGFHPIGGTEYMFDPAEPVIERILSLFHVWVPILLLWAVWRLGYDRRGWKLQTAIAWVVLPLSLFPDPERNINWLWRPFGIEQTWMHPGLFLLVAMVVYPLALYLPTHWLLAWWAKRSGRPVVPEG